MLEKLERIEARYEQINELMGQPEMLGDYARLQELAREQSSIAGLVEKYRAYKATDRSLREAAELIETESDPEIVDLAREELEQLKTRKEELLAAIKLALVPKDPNDERDIIVEIRAGTGGEEAALFAGDLYRMYTRYAELQRWHVEVIDAHESDIGGFKEIVFEVKGKGAYSKLKYESGVHRVQRVPVTEAQGRIHTSTATVAVLPEVEEVEVAIRDEDLRIDTYCSGGAGGQNVNKVATAVRITHLPTGMVVTCQDERSQLKNKVKAMAVLRARLYDVEQRKQTDEVTEARRLQVGTGERAEKIRTYNFPQDRVTDHRIGLTLHSLPRLLAGEISELVEAVASADQAEWLQAAGIASDE